MGALKTTGPDPLTTDHAIVRVLPMGSPSSVADPARVTTALPFASETDWFGPALTTGGLFCGFTCTEVYVVAETGPFVAVNEKTYVPFVVKLADVDSCVGVAIVAGAGPCVCAHKYVSVPDGPFGVAVPVKVDVLVGNVIVPGEAEAPTNGACAAGFTVICAVP